MVVNTQCALPRSQQSDEGDNSQNYWQDVAGTSEVKAAEGLPKQYRLLKVDTDQLETSLDATNTPRVILPRVDNGFFTVKLKRSSILSAELAAKYPGIRSYQGMDLAIDLVDVRIDMNPSGFYAMITTKNGAYFINPVSNDPGYYVCYDKKYARKDMKNPFFEAIQE